MHGTFNTSDGAVQITGVMQIMDQTGHTTTTWDVNRPDEVEAAREQFNSLTRKGYQAFRVEGANNQGERLREFDPKAGKIMMVPQLVGG